MALTDHCDVFGSFHEDGFNAILGHMAGSRRIRRRVRLRRPG